MTEATEELASSARHRTVTWQDPLAGAALARASADAAGNGHGR